MQHDCAGSVDVLLPVLVRKRGFVFVEMYDVLREIELRPGLDLVRGETVIPRNRLKSLGALLDQIAWRERGRAFIVLHVPRRRFFWRGRRRHVTRIRRKPLDSFLGFFIPSFKRRLVAGISLFQVFAGFVIFVNLRKFKRCASVTGIGRLLEPFYRLVYVLRDSASAMLAVRPHPIHPERIAVLGRLRHPCICPEVALRYALTVLVAQGKSVLCIGIATFGRVAEALESLVLILPYSIAVVVCHAKIEHGGGIA